MADRLCIKCNGLSDSGCITPEGPICCLCQLQVPIEHHVTVRQLLDLIKTDPDSLLYVLLDEIHARRFAKTTPAERLERLETEGQSVADYLTGKYGAEAFACDEYFDLAQRPIAGPLVIWGLNGNIGAAIAFMRILGKQAKSIPA